MVQFVDLRLTNIGYRFAFFDAGNELFMKFNGSHCWLIWEDFKKDFYEEHKGEAPTTIQKNILEYYSPAPVWVHSCPQPNPERNGHGTLAFDLNVDNVTLQNLITFSAFTMDEARATTQDITPDKVMLESFGVSDGFSYVASYSW